jgi:hypothetical protein
MIRRALLVAALLVAAVPVARATAFPQTWPAVSTHGYRALVGPLHEHSDYSDGYPGATPATAFASAKSLGNDFMGISDHSDTLAVPLVASNECLGAGVVNGPGGDAERPANVLRKWDATQEYANEATAPEFTALRGFEWTSDRYGHINVFFSQNYANAKGDGGYASMQAFYQWFQRPPALAGGSDGLATFNHPGDKKLQVVGGSDPGVNWDDFAYEPSADDRMVGIELYNTRAEYGRYYSHALDKGWHVGAVGAEDLGHNRGDDWGGPSWAKTVVLAPRNDAASIRDAMFARRFYAIARPGIALDFTVDRALMGSRLTRRAGAPMWAHVVTNQPGAKVELVTSGGAVVASGTGRLDALVRAATSQRWYFVRAVDATGRPIAYSSPIWVTAPAA